MVTCEWLLPGWVSQCFCQAWQAPSLSAGRMLLLLMREMHMSFPAKPALHDCDNDGERIPARCSSSMTPYDA